MRLPSSSLPTYRDRLRDAFVILDRAERRAIIERELKAQAEAEGLTVRDDPALLDEVSGSGRMAGAVDRYN